MSPRTRRRRPKRPDRISAIVDPIPRFIAGMLAMPAFLLLDNLIYKGFLVILFAIAATLAGKRIRWTYFLVLAFSICFFHLLAPLGRVLFRIGPLPVTLGALETGLNRTFTLIGMVFLSLTAVRPELELPGFFGGLLARTFYHFEAILDGKTGLTRKNFFTSLDQLLLERFDPRKEDFGHKEPVSPALPEQKAPEKRASGTRDSGNAETESENRNGAALPSGATGRAVRGRIPAVLFALLPWGFWVLALLGLSWT